jgi:hypothetical protein
MNLILFDLYAGGHHGQYARTLVDYWHREGLPGRLHLVVSEAFVQQHQEAAAPTQCSTRSPRSRLSALGADPHPLSPPWPSLARDAKIPRNLAPRADEGPEKSPSWTEDARA